MDFQCFIINKHKRELAECLIVQALRAPVDGDVFLSRSSLLSMTHVQEKEKEKKPYLNQLVPQSKKKFILRFIIHILTMSFLIVTLKVNRTCTDLFFIPVSPCIQTICSRRNETSPEKSK